MTRAHAVVDTPIGPLTVIADGNELREVRFPNAPPSAGGAGPCVRHDAVLVEAAHQLGEYFDGTRVEFDLPLGPVGTPFQLAAWWGLATIPYGETVSYGEQARRLGLDGGTARAVGAANGRNPLPIVLPCHRVIGSDGRLVGFGGGLETKAWLLHHERRVTGVALPF
ncbi:MAG: methylated-DNA--[protein]-cysteine S-methyltransferase [Ilumatobacteraceae bacterium]